jgi:broad specificity phosphatase PhoE
VTGREDPRETAETVVHMLRHGEVHNPDKILYGRLPGFHLSERGRAMADRVREYLGTADLVRVVSSPMERAVETAAPIAAAHGLETAIDDRLTEAGNVFQGKRVGVGDGVLRHPQHWRHLTNPFRPSWGEPYADVAARALAAAEDARAAAAGHEALLVSHQLPIWIARLACEGRRLWHDPRRRECSLASLTSLRYRGAELVSVTYAEPAGDLLPGASTVSGA